MGNLQAEALAGLAGEGYSLRALLAVNLQSNHYPPLPTAYVDPILKALDAVVTDGPHVLIALPEGINPLPREAQWNEDAQAQVVPAGYLIDITHSWSFLPGDEED